MRALSSFHGGRGSNGEHGSFFDGDHDFPIDSGVGKRIATLVEGFTLYVVELCVLLG